MPSTNPETFETSAEPVDKTQHQAPRHNTKAPWVALLGLDGSGKSTVMQEVEKLFSPPLFAGVKTFYRHPGFLYTHRVESQRDSSHSGDDQIVRDHFADPPHGAVKSIVKLGIFALDWLIGYWGNIVRLRAKGYLIILDRYYWVDLIIAPIRYRYGASPRLTRLAPKILPKPDLVIWLDAPIEVLQSRKKEVPLQEATRQRSAYLELIPKLSNSYTVDASKPLEEVVSEVRQIILGHGQAGKDLPDQSKS